MEYFRKRGEKNKREKEIPSSGNRLSWAFARDCRLKEIPSSGNRLSWAGVREIMSNGVKEKVWVQCRLDRAFGNAEWFRLFPNSHSFYLEKTGSDHRPIFTGLDATVQRRTGRRSYVEAGAWVIPQGRHLYRSASVLVEWSYQNGSEQLM
ncbi:Endonuclease/exonuclease/phosphatase protein [Raphanus sativus]|nr:Endonuclease/exonuclease/phosphatase protein [Raphanus sativus]